MPYLPNCFSPQVAEIHAVQLIADIMSLQHKLQSKSSMMCNNYNHSCNTGKR